MSVITRGRTPNHHTSTNKTGLLPSLSNQFVLLRSLLTPIVRISLSDSLVSVSIRRASPPSPSRAAAESPPSAISASAASPYLGKKNDWRQLFFQPNSCRDQRNLGVACRGHGSGQGERKEDSRVLVFSAYVSCRCLPVGTHLLTF